MVKWSMMETKLKSGTTLVVALEWLSRLLKEWISNGAPEIGFLAPDLVLYLDMPPEMVDACQRIEDVQKQLQEIVLDHVLAGQKAIFVAQRVADERCEPSPGSDGYEVRLDSAIIVLLKMGMLFYLITFPYCCSVGAPKIGLLAPDLVLHLDMPPEKASERGGYEDERYELLEFQMKVAQFEISLFVSSVTIDILDLIAYGRCLPKDRRCSETAEDCFGSCLCLPKRETSFPPLVIRRRGRLKKKLCLMRKLIVEGEEDDDDQSAKKTTTTTS
ncbi:hypothetical protein Dsin_005176 [Dipteronia sinensis]|uniref:Uncharacterized protein n=1 Tax=Dipteronia sinensis TaxID=43782 RepID=A0AAE0AXB0_9ROSI|nr:hypothetical protein Dsin_005176 [Dipteronia sinensis]